jgi:Na+/melibiose symporter-like transporter
MFGWASWGVVIHKLSPYVSPAPALVFFYTSFFIAHTATFALLGFYLRVWLNKNEVYYQHINIALRHGVLLSVIMCTGLFFQRLRVLTWWDGLLLVLIMIHHHLMVNNSLCIFNRSFF